MKNRPKTAAVAGELEARNTAVAVLQAVIHGPENLSEALSTRLPGLADERDRSLVRELCYGVLRWLPRLRFFLGRLLSQGLRPRDADIECIVLLGLYQLEHTRVPPYAAVDSAVALAAARRKGWARGLVNAVLRRYQRERAVLAAAAEQDPSARFAHPQWLIAELRRTWPDHWQDILAANNAHAAMTLRVNARRLTRDDYLARLGHAGIEAVAGRFSPQAVMLASAQDVYALPGFADGMVSVQDEAAQLAGPLLAVRAGERVLDACAAPGGKTAQLLETCPEPAHLLALDRDPRRAGLITDTLDRLGLACEVRAADAARPQSWWDGEPFQRILVDAPCSATGVIRRHPDIKVRRAAGQLSDLAAAQSALLEALWPTLAVGGTLLYATCSILPLENADIVDAFLARHGDARNDPIAAQWGRGHGAGRQILPGDGGMDGFFYARLQKI